jgi:putative FmdB family regulatory protein
MPIYEYECENCKFYTELLQKISDPPLTKCPSCGKNKMKKLVSAPVFRLKGGGWYETDFKSDNENKRNLAVEKEPESASTDTKTSDAKGAEKGGDAKATPAAAAGGAEAKSTAASTGESKGSSSKAAASKSRGSKSPAASGASRGRGSPAASRTAAARSKPAPKPKSKPAARGKKRR